MSSLDLTLPKVFIIESLTFSDESHDYFEGQIISKILKMSGIEHKYFYVRTEKELKALLSKFYDLRYRYLHLSCHGNNNSIATTLDKIPFSRLADLLKPNLFEKRLFLSACLSTNDDLANEIIKKTGCYSIIGSDEKIYIDDAAIFWASFYQLMFKQNSRVMTRDTIEPTLKKLVEIHKLPIRYFTKRINNKKGWIEVNLE
jgi:hypothetical protein